MRSLSLGSILLFLLLPSCGKDPLSGQTDETSTGFLPAFVSAVDVSFYPEIEASGFSYRDPAGATAPLLDFMKEQGVNTVRLRLWVNPESGRSGLAEVRAFTARLKSHGYRVWITAHYSDSWADPGTQEPPAAWAGLDFESLKDEVARYTFEVIRELEPDIYQIGNEINPGILLPTGDRFDRKDQFLQLLQTASTAARAADSNTRILLHYAGLDGASAFFSEVASIDYDLIGVSYYPWWHGRSLGTLQSVLENLGTENEKEVILAETAYPFTLGFNDFTNNIIGLESQLFLPQFPATAQGQRNFLLEVREITRSTTRGKGFCYWSPEWVAFKGTAAPDGSPWENNALFDFEGRALPAWEVFDLNM